VSEAAGSDRIDLPATEAAPLVQLVREISGLLADLVSQYEVGRRLSPVGDRVVRKPADVVEHLGSEMADLAQEQLRVVLVDTKNRVLATSLVYQGGLNSIVVRLADCFREAVRANAAAIILVHNHPSGEADPSEEDILVTEDASRAGDLLGIDVLDHVVIGNHEKFVSLRERGLYTPVKYQPASRRRKTAACCAPTWEILHA
jgi:DNA repair protein RadC